MRLYLKTALWHGLMLTGMLLAGFIVIAPFWAVFVGSDIDLGPARALATAALVCLYGWTALAGVEVRGARRHASLLSSVIVALSFAGLLTGLFAVWPVGDAAGQAYERWLLAGALLAATALTLAVGMLRRELET
jgi:hypothetical protein